MLHFCQLCRVLSGQVEKYFETANEATIHAMFHFRQSQFIGKAVGTSITEKDVFHQCFIAQSQPEEERITRIYQKCEAASVDCNNFIVNAKR